MSDLPTREKVTEWLDEFCATGEEPLDLVILRQRLVPMYADGVLQTRQEFIDSLDYEAAANQVRANNPKDVPAYEIARRVVVAALGVSDE